MLQSSPRSSGGAGRIARRVPAVALLLCTLLVSVAATGLRGPRYGGTIIVTWQTTLTTVDPAYTYGAQDWPQCHAIFDGLLGYPGNSSLTLIPHLAASLPAASNGGRTYTFHLKHGLVFSNGDPVTAQDFVYSWERMLAPKTASPDTYLWYAVQGESAFAAGKAKHVSGFKVLDPYTLQITLAQPDPGFLYVLTTPSWAPFTLEQYWLAS
jgi:ABC-type transport system substrate-binding protein